LGPLGANEASAFPQAAGAGGEVAPEVGVLEGVAFGTGVVVYTPLLEQPAVIRTARTASAEASVAL
jgi:hypothetical protein